MKKRQVDSFIGPIFWCVLPFSFLETRSFDMYVAQAFEVLVFAAVSSLV